VARAIVGRAGGNITTGLQRRFPGLGGLWARRGDERSAMAQHPLTTVTNVWRTYAQALDQSALFWGARL